MAPYEDSEGSFFPSPMARLKDELKEMADELGKLDAMGKRGDAIYADMYKAYTDKSQLVYGNGNGTTSGGGSWGETFELSESSVSATSSAGAGGGEEQSNVMMGSGIGMGVATGGIVGPGTAHPGTGMGMVNTGMGAAAANGLLGLAEMGMTAV